MSTLVPPRAALLPIDPCTDCGRRFITKAYAAAHGTNEAYTTHSGRGLCPGCRRRRRRAGVALPPPVRRALTPPPIERLPPMSAQPAALRHYLAGRRRRLERSRRRALAATLGGSR